MADFNLSAVVTLEASEAVAGGQALENSIDGVAAAEARAANAAGTLASSTGRASGEMQREAGAARSATGAISGQERATERATGAANAHATSMTREGAASSQVGTQVRGMAQQVAQSVNPVANLGAQGGATTGKLSGLGNVAGVVANFLAGGFVGLVGSAIGALVQFATTTDKASDAMKLAETGADALGQAQGVLGSMFDLTSGKIEHQNGLLVANARLTAINLRAQSMAERTSSEQTFSRGLEPRGGMFGGFLSRISGRSGGMEGANLLRPYIQRIAGAKTPEERQRAIEAALMGTEKTLTPGADPNTDVLGNLSRITTQQWRQALVDMASADEKKRVAELIDQSLNSGSLAPGLRRDPRKKTPRKKAGGGNAAERLEEFGEDAANRIASLAGRFSGQPKLIEQAAAAMRQLDDIVDDINRKKPPNLKTLLADAAAAREAIRNGVNRPYEEFILAQNDSLKVAQLVSQGRQDEADALRITLGLEREMGRLTPERRDAVLATVQALHEEERRLDALRVKQENLLRAVGSIKSAIYDVIRDPVEGLKDLPGRLVNAFATLKADQLFESMFGQTFRDIEDRIKGANVAEDAAERMATAVDQVTSQTDRTTTALDQLAQAASNAAAGVSGDLGATGPPVGSRLAGAAEIVNALPADAGATGLPPTPDNAAGEQAITVTARNPPPAESFSNWIERLARGVGIGDTQKERDRKRDEAKRTGVEISDDAASKIGKFAGKGIEGAATGAMINSFLRPLGKELGFRTSRMGAEIGGAIASALPQVIPFQKEIGAIIGSIAGGLLKTAKTGSATISSVYDAASIGGNSKSLRAASGTAAASIQDTILNIAEQLGGGLGSFNVSIGQRDGQWRVDPTGKGNTRKKKGALDFGEDSAAAMSAAVIDAIRDGAVTGLSAAVSSALKSSPDLERALREAMKVRELEDLIGGLGSSLNRQFVDFDRVAAERVRLAKKYGLDLLAVERINGEQRAELIDNLIKSRIGGLLDFQNEMKFGDLFEGDAPTRRAALIEEIGKVQPKAEAGDEGAADQLADLYRRLIGTSEEAFGTAGPELAADRTAAAEGIERVIKMENDRIAAAAAQQQAQTDALNKNNTLTDETNHLIATGNAKLDAILNAVAGGGGVSTLIGAESAVRFVDLRSV